MIHTVRGDILKEELGVTMCHEHLAMDLSPVRGDDDSTFRDLELIYKEAKKMADLGAQAVIEVTCNDMGRDVPALRELSEKLGIHIVASTGFYLAEYHTDWVKAASIKDIKELFQKELTIGIENSGIKAGLIAEVAGGSTKLRASEIKVLKAASRASKETGCAVSTHCDMGKLAREQLDLLLGEGMQPQNIILGHLDLIEDVNYHMGLLKQGVNIAFDTIGKVKYLSDEKRADNFMKLIHEGYEKQLLLSQDVSRKSYLTKQGGAGYTAVLGYFKDLLEERGITKQQLEQVLIHNPSRIIEF